MAHASPRKFLAATATQGRIKRALSVEELDTKRVRLDPKHLPIESKMRKCQARAQKALPNDRQNIPLLETDQWHLGEERTEVRPCYHRAPHRKVTIVAARIPPGQPEH